MKRLPHHLMLILFLFLLACRPQDAPQGQQAQTLSPDKVSFSFKGGCAEAVVKELDAAKALILVQAYSFTSAPIAKALVKAHQRGVKVEVIFGESQRTKKHSEADFLVNMGIPTKIDTKHAIADNKMVIDGETVIMGLFDFTKQAEQVNAANLLVIRDKALAENYTAKWKAHDEHSVPYLRKEKGYLE